VAAAAVRSILLGVCGQQAGTSATLMSVQHTWIDCARSYTALWPLGRGTAKQTHVVQQYKAGVWLRDNSINISNSESMLWCTMQCTRVQWADRENASLGECQQSVSQCKQWWCVVPPAGPICCAEKQPLAVPGHQYNVHCSSKRSWCWQGVSRVSAVVQTCKDIEMEIPGRYWMAA
jgi:hypothetical protein